MEEDTRLLELKHKKKHHFPQAWLLCKSPVEPPLVAVLALAVGGEDWPSAVSNVAGFRAPTKKGRDKGSWILYARTGQFAVLQDLELPAVEAEPWCT